MKTKTDQLIESLKTSFNGNPWYGDAIFSRLKTIDYRLVNTAPFSGCNTIGNIVQHLIAWRRMAIEVLNGNGAYKIAVNSSEDWPNLPVESEETWTKYLLQLESTQQELLRRLSEFSDDMLAKQAYERNYSLHFLVEGIVQHDIYHLGQITILEKQIQSQSVH